MIRLLILSSLFLMLAGCDEGTKKEPGLSVAGMSAANYMNQFVDKGDSDTELAHYATALRQKLLIKENGEFVFDALEIKDPNKPEIRTPIKIKGTWTTKDLLFIFQTEESGPLGTGQPREKPQDGQAKRFLLLRLSAEFSARLGLGFSELMSDPRDRETLDPANGGDEQTSKPRPQPIMEVGSFKVPTSQGSELTYKYELDVARNTVSFMTPPPTVAGQAVWVMKSPAFASLLGPQTLENYCKGKVRQLEDQRNQRALLDELSTNVGTVGFSVLQTFPADFYEKILEGLNQEFEKGFRFLPEKAMMAEKEMTPMPGSIALMVRGFAATNPALVDYADNFQEYLVGLPGKQYALNFAELCDLVLGKVAHKATWSSSSQSEQLVPFLVNTDSLLQ